MLAGNDVEMGWGGTPKRLNVRQDVKKEIIKIEGINYHFDLFRGLGTGKSGLVLNKPFQIIKREDGVIAIEKIKKTGRVK